MQTTKFDFKLFNNVVLEGIDHRDYPDYCDAFIDSADYDGKEMTDEQLVRSIIKSWDLLSPDKPTLGGVTVVKLLQPGAWGTDRLLFTLQCVFVCMRKHKEVVAKHNAEWLQSGMNWTNTTPQQQFDEHAIVGTDSQRERSTYAWMAEAVRTDMT